MLGFWLKDTPPATTGAPEAVEHLGPNMWLPAQQPPSKLHWRRKIHNLGTNPRWPKLLVEPLGDVCAPGEGEATPPIACKLEKVRTRACEACVR